jgi:cytochrome c oxidase cbb3-type subunit III
MKYKSMIYRLFTFLTFLFSAAISNAQEAVSSPNAQKGIMDLLFENIILVLGVVVVIAAFGTVIYLFNVLLQLQKTRMMKEQGVEIVEKAELVEKESWVSTLYEKLTGTKPIEEEEDILFDHEYDGIRELDNSLPPWWLALFYITIAFAVVYIGYYELSDYGLNPDQEYAQEMEYAEQAQLALLAKQANKIDETNVEIVEDAAFISAGKSIFDKSCIACHGMLGEGNVVGPNLTDEYWIHGGGIKNVFKTIKYGVVEKGMQSWKDMLSPEAMHQVANYILTLQGTNPPNQRDPQGDIWKSEE